MHNLERALERIGPFARALDRVIGAIAPSLKASAPIYVGYTCCPTRVDRRCDVYYYSGSGTYSCSNCTSDTSC